MKSSAPLLACLENNATEMIRSVFVCVNAIISFLILVNLHLFLCVRDSSGNLAHSVSARLWSRWILLCSGIKVRVRGVEHILQDQPQIFFCNHKSLLDIPCLQAYLPAQFRYLAKEELFHIPVFGTALTRTGYLPIDRTNPRKAYRSMVAAIEHIKSGTSLMIFPEGTRSFDDRLLPFKTGGTTLAIRAQVPVVPVVILGTERILPKGTLRLNTGPVEIRIGRPISTKDFEPSDKLKFSNKVRGIMMAMLGDQGS